MKKIFTKGFTYMRNSLLSAATLVIGMSLAHGFPIITNVVETGGDNEATDTVPAKWTGVTYSAGIANEPIIGAPAGASYTVGLFRVAAPSYVDRAHAWTNASATVLMPSYLIGGEYIMSGNDNRDNGSYRLDIYVSGPVRAYLLMDNRVGDSANANPPLLATNTQWVLDDGWAPVTNGINRTANMSWPDEIGIDEGGDGSINQYLSIYSKLFPAGMFQTRQQNAGGLNMYGVVVVPASSPTTPTNLLAVSADSKVTLFWAAAGGAANYYVKRSQTQGGPYAIVASNIVTTYINTAVVNDQTYYYVVSATNALGESANSTEVIGQPKASPQNLVAVGGTNQVKLTWTPFAGAASYSVQRSEITSGPYTEVGAAVTASEFLDTSLLVPGRTYYYVVQANLTGGGQSGVSAEASAVTAPSAPGASVSVYATTVLRLGWTTTNLVLSQFVIEQSLDGTTFTPLATLPGTERGYTNSGLTLATTYFYRVQAQNVSGFSGYSAVVSNTTPVGGWNVNFANATNGQPTTPAPTPPGCVQDVGNVYGDRGNGYSYGWDRDITLDGRWRQRAASPDLRYDTFIHLMKADIANPSLSAIWNLELPNGFYLVHIVAGDADNVNSVYQFDVEGVITPASTPNASNVWREFTATCIIGDGRLTINSGPQANNNKIAFIDIYPAVAVPLAIGTQPQPQTITENRPVTFAVAVTNGSTPIYYQWYYNDSPISGATTPTLSFGITSLTQAGNYYAVISNYAGAVTSSVVHLTVDADVAPPHLVSVGSLNGQQIGLVFDEIISASSGTELAVFSINHDEVGVTDAILRPDGKTVVLTLETPITGSFTVDTLDVYDIAVMANAGPSSAMGVVLLPTALTQDIGRGAGIDPLYAGTTFVGSSNSIEVLAGGTDIGNTNDGFRMVYLTSTGNFDVKTKVESLVRIDSFSKAGLMARETLNPDSRHIGIFATPSTNDNGGGVFQVLTRTATNTAATTLASTSELPYPVWLRLQRSGNTFISYYGSNGVNWVALNTNTPSSAYSNSVLVGLATTAHNNSSNIFTKAVYTEFGNHLPAPSATQPVWNGASFAFKVQTVTGYRYTLVYKNSLTDAGWLPGDTQIGDGGVLMLSDPGPLPTMRFYSIKVE